MYVYIHTLRYIYTSIKKIKENIHICISNISSNKVVQISEHKKYFQRASINKYQNKESIVPAGKKLTPHCGTKKLLFVSLFAD